MTRKYEPVSRRQVLKAGAATGLGLAFPGLAGAAAEFSCVDQICRKIPSTGEALPVMGVGTNRFGRAGVATAKEVLGEMYGSGGRVIDTAAMYGESEAVIGQALGELGLRDKMFIATKFNAAGASFGPPPGSGAPPGAGGPPGAGAPAGAGGPPRPAMGNDVSGLDSFERSLDRLQMDSVDLLFAHFVGSVEPLMPIMLDLKEKGRTRYIGITSVQRAQHPQIMEYMREYPIDFLQIDYSLASRDTATDVLPLAMERKIAVMVAVPFGGGRNSLFSSINGRDLPEWAADFGAETWGQFFLKYIVAHPAVTCVIPGTTDTEHMADNLSAGRGALPNEEMLRRMEKFWDGTA